MTQLIPVKYRIFTYPAGITPEIQEIAGHLDKTGIRPGMSRFSLHTEYSFGGRSLNSAFLAPFEELRQRQVNGVPQLWYSVRWAEQFAAFLQKLCGTYVPSVIEIHPPFGDYADTAHFFAVYTVFEQAILSACPEVTLLIENRCGTRYPGAGFILSDAADMIAFAEGLQKSGLRLRITWDIPQLFSAMQTAPRTMEAHLEQMKPVLPYIDGIHLWGKGDNGGRQWVPHCGDLNTYFRGNTAVKEAFLLQLHALLDDDRPRYFVPEVNSGQADLDSIVRDLLRYGFTFV